MRSKKYTIDELHIGLSFAFTRVITHEDIKLFCELTGDFHPLHFDREYAKENGFKNIIAHGALLTSIASKLIGMELPGQQSLVMSECSEYHKVVIPEDELTFTGTIYKVRKSLSIVVVKISITNQTYEEVGVIEFTVKIRK